ncbi:MAG: 6-carboxytetrahydropterin synthase [Bryobacteraceae bacterium]
MIRLTRRFRFSASHRLHSEALTESANRELYGKCNNPYGHGHDYVLEVSLRGPIDANSGRVANPAVLDSLVRSCVLDAFEHKNLNLDVSEFQTVVPTSENILKTIEKRLNVNWKRSFPGEWPALDLVHLRETRKNSFELKA